MAYRNDVDYFDEILVLWAMDYYSGHLRLLFFESDGHDQEDDDRHHVVPGSCQWIIITKEIDLYICEDPLVEPTFIECPNELSEDDLVHTIYEWFKIEEKGRKNFLIDKIYRLLKDIPVV